MLNIKIKIDNIDYLIHYKIINYKTENELNINIIYVNYIHFEVIQYDRLKLIKNTVLNILKTEYELKEQ